LHAINLPKSVISKKRKMTESTGNILAIDIGGSHIKGTILDSGGKVQTEYRKLPTPALATPEAVIGAIKELVKDLPGYEKVSVGFPGYVRNGVVFTAPNLGNAHWEKIDLGQQISDLLHKPVRLINDADQLGLGVVSGKGDELAVTLGTGVGTAVLVDGVLLPHLELSHHPISKGRDYDEYLGSKALQDAGKEKWNKRVAKMLAVLKTVFNYDRLYLGGGSVKELEISLEDNIHLFNNQDGIKGGAKLWELEEKHHITTNYPR
jgi:polyphosphate glucokinase